MDEQQSVGSPSSGGENMDNIQEPDVKRLRQDPIKYETE